MKNKLILTVSVATMLIIATVAMANGTLITETFFETSTDSSESFFAVEEDFEFGLDLSNPPEPPTAPLYEFIVEEDIFFDEFAEASLASFNDYITVEHLGLDEQKQIKNKFINTLVDYRMTSDEMEYITSLTEDYDVDTLLEIYEFLRWTDADISKIPEIYHAGEGLRDNKHWIYDAYDKAFNRTDDMLSVEDVAHYVASGLTIDEIAGAYELSFAGIKSTKQMLDERLDGATWNTIAAQVLTDTPEVVINAPEMTMDEIMGFRNISVRQRKDFAEIADVQGERVELNEEARAAERTRILEKDRLMVEYGVTPIADETTEERTVEYANGKPQVFSVKEEREEDLIPVEEPEVE